MTWVDGVIALAVIIGFGYIVVSQMNKKHRGRNILSWTADKINPGNLFKKNETSSHNTKEQLWRHKRDMI